MADVKPPFKLTDAQRQVGDVIAAFALKVARPLYWHSGALNPERAMQGGTAFVLEMDGGFIGVTACHVLRLYEEALKKNPKLVCQLYDASFRPEECLIDASDDLDLATFKVPREVLDQFKGNTIDCRGAWPPPDVKVGVPLALAGYPEHMRVPTTPGHMDFVAIGSLTIADDVTDRHIITTYDPARDISPGWAVGGMPPLGLNMSGASGGPVIMQYMDGKLMRFIPVGLIVEGPTGRTQVDSDRAALGELGTFDRIKIRRLTCINADGTLKKEPTGWLPPTPRHG